MNQRTERARSLRSDATEAEAKLWRHLRNRELAGSKWRRQDSIGPYFADFACRESRLVVEVDGSQHYEPHGESWDAQRTEFMQSKGWRVLRFNNHEVLMEIDAVLETILLALQKEL